jgi:lipopolysaccharide/colanic/teichoic acid biosynthesis glycosyltransferase
MRHHAWTSDTPDPPACLEAAARPAGQRGRALKRPLDVAVAGVLLALAAPVLVVAAALILLVDGRPVLFWQTRVGARGRPFAFPKLRSMRHGAEHLHATLAPRNDHGDSITFKMRDDPRITPLGRLLRVTSVDELPQLWSVLCGDMSLVGPRPPLPEEVERYTPWQRRRLDVKPGLTCLWQVYGRSDLPFGRQVALDVEYIERQSLALDLKLMLLTIPAVLSGRGAA